MNDETMVIGTTTNASDIAEEKTEEFSTVVTVVVVETDAEGAEPNEEADTAETVQDSCMMENTEVAKDVECEATEVVECHEATEDTETVEECKTMEETNADMCGTVDYQAKCTEYEATIAEYEVKFAEYEKKFAEMEEKFAALEMEKKNFEDLYNSEKIGFEKVKEEQLVSSKVSEAQSVFEKYSTMSGEDKVTIFAKANDTTVNEVDFKALLYEYSRKYDSAKKYVYTTYPIIGDKAVEVQKKLTFEEKVKARNGK